jgi:molybdopterin molybdotransferase
MISFKQAMQLTLDNIHPLEAEEVPIVSAAGRTAASDLVGRVDVPSVNVSLKDGYALRSNDVSGACEGSPALLRLIGSVAAGAEWRGQVDPGASVRILSGAALPIGADAVLAEEFARQQEDHLLVTNDAHPGRNILHKGSDVRRGEILVSRGARLNPPSVGLLAAAGYKSVTVFRLPRVAILATGDEVIAPGETMQPGKLFASNLVTLAAWCLGCGCAVNTLVVRDNEDMIRERLLDCLQESDAVLTSGGAWSGERDFVVRILDEIGWMKIYHRVRIGPGKAVAFGMVANRPVFCLPGGPPSNHMAFLQLALPGLHKLSGLQALGLPSRTMQLAESVRGQSDWTQFIQGRLVETETSPLALFYPLNQPSRLQMMSAADAILCIDEGISTIQKGQVFKGQLLR